MAVSALSHLRDSTQIGVCAPLVCNRPGRYDNNGLLLSARGAAVVLICAQIDHYVVYCSISTNALTLNYKLIIN